MSKCRDIFHETVSCMRSLIFIVINFSIWGLVQFKYIPNVARKISKNPIITIIDQNIL